MIRLILAVIAAILAAAAGAFFALNPGTATFQFLGWRAELPFVVAAGGLILFAFLFLVLWWGIYLAWTSPDKMKAFLSRRRREQGYDALEKALIASAAGDGEAAVRQAEHNLRPRQARRQPRLGGVAKGAGRDGKGGDQRQRGAKVGAGADALHLAPIERRNQSRGEADAGDGEFPL